ncbi:MAG: aspartate 1-decarboxylase [Lentisphaerae bacterium GWF2_52_8]|nr:MAG: aspartate 1-decarboxylase [Lentisphaerae bacterium GWF2_52_8]
MNVQICRGKIHRARLTACVVDYEGSLEIDSELLAESGILPYEKILVVNASNGERLETYAIPGKPGSRIFSLNGAAALKGKPGNIITIMAFGICSLEEAKGFVPRVIVMNEENRIVARKGIESC